MLLISVTLVSSAAMLSFARLRSKVNDSLKSVNLVSNAASTGVRANLIFSSTLIHVLETMEAKWSLTFVTLVSRATTLSVTGLISELNDWMTQGTSSS